MQSTETTYNERIVNPIESDRSVLLGSNIENRSREASTVHQDIDNQENELDFAPENSMIEGEKENLSGVSGVFFCSMELVQSILKLNFYSSITVNN